MTAMPMSHQNGWQSVFANAIVSKWPHIVLLLTICLFVSCSHLTAPDIPKDEQAENIVRKIVQGDSALTGFSCVAKIVLAMPDQPVQYFRSAIAGRQTDRLRMDLLTPFGGSSATIASDGRHLFADVRSSGEFYKRRIGKGDLSRVAGINVTVGEMLNFLMGRIPVDQTHVARMVRDTNSSRIQVELVDRRGIVRQRIDVDEDGRPIQVQWLDEREMPTRTLFFSGKVTIDGFVLPETIQLTDASKARITIIIQRYKPNAAFDDGIFTIDRGRRTNGK